MGVPVGLAHHLVYATGLRPARRDLLGALAAAVHEHHVRVLRPHPVQREVHRSGVADGAGTGDRHQRPLGQVRLRLFGLARPEEVAGVDRRRSQLRRPASVRPVPRAPGVAGVLAVALGGGVPELLEGVSPVAEVLRALGDPFQLPGLDFGAVLGILQVPQFRRELVDRPVQPHRLHVQGVDEAPQQRLALVGELGAVRGDLVDEGVEDGVEAREGFRLIPDGSWDRGRPC